MNLASIRRKIIEPLYLKNSGSPKISYWRILEKTQFYSIKQLEEIQWQRLQKIWDFIWKNNSFYKNRFIEAGLTFDSLKEPADISLLPILTKKDIRSNTDSIISTGFSKDKLQHFKTGGSTGKALDIYITEECSEQRNACARRHDRWTGWEVGEPVAAVWGNPKLPVTVKEKIINTFVQPYIYLDTMAVTDKSVLQFVDEWKKINPTLLFGHAHSIYVLAKYLKKLEVDILHPTGIISTSMMLLPHERSFIEKVFDCKVTDRYGCEEVSLIGCECKNHDGMHMNIEHLFIEFIKDDGSIAKDNEEGNIIVTDLMNMAMPLIRYKVEDIGIRLERQCSCGCKLPLMGKVTGRVADFLIKKDGTRVSGISLIENTLTKLVGIDQMQIIQNDLETFEINIVPGTRYSRKIAKELKQYFNELFGDDVRIDIHEIKEIVPEKSGKFRFSICRVQ